MNGADFTRNRLLPLPHLVAILLNLRKGSIGDAEIPAGTPEQSDRLAGRVAGTAGPQKAWSVDRDGVDLMAMTFLKPSLRARTITA
jgi:hypothetical protein